MIKEGIFHGKKFVSHTASAPACMAGMAAREGSKWSLTRMGFPEKKNKGIESHCGCTVCCKSLTSVTFSLIPHSPNYLYAFFSLTKDESKRPKYKELLVSSQCYIFQCLQHTARMGLGSGRSEL